MSLFKPAKNESAFLKMGLMGNAGSGKTLTSCLTAIGLITHCRSLGLEYAKKPVFFLDSENGSDYVQDLFAEAEIELLVLKSKSFKDLCAAMPEAEKNASLLLIDSVSAYWDEWKKSYQAAKGGRRLQFDDFATIKDKWREGFTDKFINSKLHCIMCGRLAYEWDYSIDEDTGKKQLEKTDVKMAAEKELGYESSLFAMMERDRNLKTHEVIRTVTILKDRFRAIDGQTFENPTFKTFAPHILKLNLSGAGAGVDLSRNSADMVPADPKRENNSIRRKIVLDYINVLLDEYGAGGTSKEAKEKRVELLKRHFKTVSKTEIEELMSLRELQANYDSLHRELTGAHAPGAEPARESDDSIPFLEPTGQKTGQSATVSKEKPAETIEETVAKEPAKETAKAEERVAEPIGAEAAATALENFRKQVAMCHNLARAKQLWKSWEETVSEFDAETQQQFGRIYDDASARIRKAVREAAE